MLYEKNKGILDRLYQRPKLATVLGVIFIIILCTGWQMVQHDTYAVVGTMIVGIGGMIFLWIFIPVLLLLNMDSSIDYVHKHPVLHLIAVVLAILSIAFSPSLQFIRTAIGDHLALAILISIAYIGLIAGYLHQIKTGKNAYEAFIAKIERRSKFLLSLIMVGTLLWAALYFIGLAFIALIDLVGLFQLVNSGVGLFF